MDFVQGHDLIIQSPVVSIHIEPHLTIKLPHVVYRVCVYVVGLILIRSNEFFPLENLPIFFVMKGNSFP